MVKVWLAGITRLAIMFPVQSVRPVSSEAQLPVHKSGSILRFKYLQVVLCGEILTHPAVHYIEKDYTIL